MTGDVDQLFVSQLPWFGVWGYEPDNSVLAELLVPASQHFMSEMGTYIRSNQSIWNFDRKHVERACTLCLQCSIGN
jgi:hypothetical protein